ncbi:ATP-binding protein [Paenibacillus sp. JJ-223]|uniref:ATP-binding protein n=1 Tax=Paenibacillus sp. JJ-223 TaxID=2905647 RepID=UPI001F3E51E1|nr:ATP-binding protein [Paenibacillus sp. JJ-223]CAH1219975.1 Sensor protein KdpD [Paenibacillus sp. JJ-223]
MQEHNRDHQHEARLEKQKLPHIWGSVSAYAWVTIAIALLTALIDWIGLSRDMVNAALVYLFPVLVSAVYWGLGPAIYAASLGAAAFDLFFIPPYFSFKVQDLRYILSFAVYLAVAILTATLSGKLRQQLETVRQREATTSLLYGLSRQITAISDMETLLSSIARQVSQMLNAPAALYLPDAEGELQASSSPARPGEPEWGTSESELAIARWVHVHGQMAGRGSSSLREASGTYVPLRTEEQVHGVLAVNMELPDPGSLPERRRLLEACADLAASAIARVKLAEEARLAQMTAESERIRTALLDSVSHELRTPLAAIMGSSTGLLENEELFTAEDRRELTANIRDAAIRMNRLVTNLLEMVKLESGMLQLRRNMCDVGDMLSVVLAQVQQYKQQRIIRLELPDQPPFVSGDEVLLEQMLVNVLSNAIKYSPNPSEIVISVAMDAGEGWLVITVADQGPGIPKAERERVFEKFYRSDSTKHVTGSGLGLAICRGIVEVHGGTIAAEANPDGGTRMVIRLPMDAADTGFLGTGKEEGQEECT